MIKKASLFLLFTLAACAAAAPGFYFLRTEKTPAAIATAQTGYVFGSVSDLGNNPASGYGDRMFSGSAAYVSLDGEENAVSLYASYADNGTFYSFQLDHLDIEGLEGREIPSDDPLYDFGAQDLVAGLTYGRKFGKGIYAAVTAKYLFEKIEYEDAIGFAGSAGVIAEDYFTDGLRLALAFNNYGTMEKLGSERTELPSDAVFGIGYCFNFANDFSMKAANSFRYLTNGSETENYTGAELGYQEKIFLRGGYRADNEGRPFSLGVGFSLGGITFDYSYTPFSDDAVGDSHALSLGYFLLKE